MIKGCIADCKLEDAGFHYTMTLIQGKYKMFILYALAEFGVVRFNALKKFIGEISFKTLSKTLKDLESDGLIHREEYPQIPPKVEYSLTKRGESLRSAVYLGRKTPLRQPPSGSHCKIKARQEKEQYNGKSCAS